MVKKIKKYLKFVVCCALILSLIAPSYAALSASDGSAFVTKAEFDSALADFNARLTTFEAGINSKIDSQVTSYLDRNGIWNGAEQTISILNGSSFTKVSNFTFSPNSSSDADTNIYINHEGECISDVAFTTDDGFLRFIYDAFQEALVPNAWKSNGSITTSTPASASTFVQKWSTAWNLMLGAPLNVIHSCSKSGLLFTNILTSAPDPRFGTTVAIQHSPYSDEFSPKDANEMPLLGNYSRWNVPTLDFTTYWCVTDVGITSLSNVSTENNYWQKYITGSFKPINCVFDGSLGDFFNKKVDNASNTFILNYRIGYVPNIFINNFFVSKNQRVWMVPVVNWQCAGGDYNTWLWTGAKWEFHNNGNVNKKDYITMKMTASVY